jgi:predicted transcriptional regulator
MTKLADASIKSFGPVPEDPVFVLTATQLQEIVQNALESKISALQEEILAFREEIALERATDRRRIAELERGHIQPMQADRGEILRALLAANGGKMLAKEARRMMHMSKQAFSNLLATMKDEIHSRPYHLDRRQIVIALK